jgi:hypothetical protein
MNNKEKNLTQKPRGIAPLIPMVSLNLYFVEKNIPICPAVHFLSEHGFSCPLF